MATVHVDDDPDQWPQEVHEAAKEEAGRISDAIDRSVWDEFVEATRLNRDGEQ